MERFRTSRIAIATIAASEIGGGAILVILIVGGLLRGIRLAAWYVPLGIGLGLTAMYAGFLLWRGNAVWLSLVLQALQVVTIASSRLGFAVVLGLYLWISRSPAHTAQMTAGFLGSFALTPGSDGGLLWSVNVIAVIMTTTLLVMIARQRSR